VVQTHWQQLPSAEIGTAHTEQYRGPSLNIAFSGDRHRTLGANNVYFVVLDGQQHSAHFNREAADEEAWKLSCELNYLQHPEEGRTEISILSFMEMMESPVEMVI
jgi:hypothetical protein